VVVDPEPLSPVQLQKLKCSENIFISTLLTSVKIIIIAQKNFSVFCLYFRCLYRTLCVYASFEALCLNNSFTFLPGTCIIVY
jgi:hypothetical protein